MKNIILLGKLNQGKTTLFHKITEASKTFTLGNGSSTTNISIKKSMFGNLSFQVIDTPGFGIEKEKINLLTEILTALIEVVKYQKIDIFKKEFFDIYKIFRRYRVMISVIVSFWNLCQQHEQENYIKEISDFLSQLRINQVLFVSKTDTSQSLCLRIENIICSLLPQKVEYSEAEIIMDFEIQQEVQNNYEKQYIRFLKEVCSSISYYKKVCILIKKKIQTADLSTNFLFDYLRALNSFAQIQSAILINLKKNNQSLIDKLTEQEQNKVFLLYFEFKKALQKEYSQLVELQNEKEVLQKVNYFQCLKQCKNCGQIWILVTGCSGRQIRCGDWIHKDLEHYNLENNKLQTFQVKYVNDEIFIQYNDEAQDKNKQNAQAIQRQFQNNFYNRLQGCGQIIEDSEQESVSKQELKAVFNDEKLLDYFSEIDKEIEKRKIKLQNQNFQLSKIYVKKVALLISNSDIQKNKIFEILQSNQQYKNSNTFQIQDWIIENAPIFNYESDQSEEFVKSYQRLFSMYKDQVFIIFLTLNLERANTNWQKFYKIYRYLIKFQSKIVVLIVDDHNDYLKEDQILIDKIQNLAKIQKYSYISKTHFRNQDLLKELIITFLERDSCTQDIGIDLSDTIFMELGEEEIDKFNRMLKIYDLINYKEELEQIDKFSSANLKEKKELEQLIQNYLSRIEKIDSDECSNYSRKNYLQKQIKQIENEKILNEQQIEQVKNGQIQYINILKKKRR